MKDNRLIEVERNDGRICTYRCSDIGIAPRGNSLRVRMVQKGETFIFLAKSVTFID